MSTTIHHADVVGSLLRPEELLDARTAMRQGKLAYQDYQLIENSAVDDALRLQEAAGLHVVTDGELRRDIYFDFFVSGMTGVEMLSGGTTVQFKGHGPAADFELSIPFSVTEKVTAKACPGVEELKYAVAKTRCEVKVTLPSPLIMMANFWNRHSIDAYPDPFDLAVDARDAVMAWMRQLAAAGCTYIQIDAPELATAYCDAEFRERTLPQLGLDPTRFIDFGTELIGTLADLELPGVRTALHVCKGNGAQSWIGEGDYGAFSSRVFKRASGFDVYHLEYDDDRSGGFEPLSHLPDDKVAVLGLVSTKWTELENVEDLEMRVREASRFHPLEKIGVATQCGFASGAETAAQRKITEQTQADKLRLVVETAQKIWRVD